MNPVDGYLQRGPVRSMATKEEVPNWRPNQGRGRANSNQEDGEPQHAIELFLSQRVHSRFAC